MRWLRWLQQPQKILNLPNRWRELEEQVRQLESMQNHLRREIDRSRSWIEVPEKLMAEFQTWKAQNTIPAKPLVSVCIATYNRSKLLTERAIPSILNQTYRHFELIVVGDACTDDTAERVARIKDDRLHFVNMGMRGVYPSDPRLRWMVAGTQPMNAALRRATGDLITHLDHDDEHVSTRLEALVDFCMSKECDLIWHPCWFETRDGDWPLNRAETMLPGNVTTGSIFYRRWFQNIEWNQKAYMLNEPGDWNRLRRIMYIGAQCHRYPEPLLKHFAEYRQAGR